MNEFGDCINHPGVDAALKMNGRPLCMICFENRLKDAKDIVDKAVELFVSPSGGKGKEE